MILVKTIGSIGIVALSACSTVPRGGVLFTQQSASACGFADIDQHNGRYLRITSEPETSGQHGGSDTHQHGFAHQHEGKASSDDRFRPIGTNELGSAANHTHEFETASTRTLQTSATENKFPSFSVSLTQSQNRSTCIPDGAIVAYLGKELPDGWELVPTAETIYLFAASSDETNSRRTSQHNHNLEHEHNWTSTASNQNSAQTFRPGQNTEISRPKHTHMVVESQISASSSSMETPQLPRVEVTFIRANGQKRSLPKDSIVGLAQTPTGSNRVGPNLFWSSAFSDDVHHFFLAPLNDIGQPRFQNASLEHAHGTSHTHDITLSRPDPTTGRADTGQNQGLSSIDHSHKTRVAHQGQTQSVSHVPLYVELYFVRKRY